MARGGELGDGPREFRLDLPELAPGKYEVRWTSYSTEDDEIARDSYAFEVLAVASPSPTATPRPVSKTNGVAVLVADSNCAELAVCIARSGVRPAWHGIGNR